MNFLLNIISALLLLSICKQTFAWDTEELEVFDVVEEVNQNFYELLGVPQVNIPKKKKKKIIKINKQTFY